MKQISAMKISHTAKYFREIKHKMIQDASYLILFYLRKFLKRKKHERELAELSKKKKKVGTSKTKKNKYNMTQRLGTGSNKNDSFMQQPMNITTK